MSNTFIARTSVDTPSPITGNIYYESDSNPFWTIPSLRMPNCTAYAYGRYYEARGGFTNKKLPTGNAKTWYYNATSFQRGKTPKLGSIMCFGGADSSDLGHVCVVEEISRDGTIKTSNSYYNGAFFAMATFSPVTLSDGTITYQMNSSHGLRSLQGFIYNDVFDVPYGEYFDFIISAILGNWYGESGLNPNVWESGFNPASHEELYGDDYKEWNRYSFTHRTVDDMSVGGYGLGQWTNVSNESGRLYNLWYYCFKASGESSQYNEFTNPEYYEINMIGELQFFLYENYWVQNVSGYGETLSDFINLDVGSMFDLSTITTIANAIRQLTYVFTRNWEGINPSAGENNKRASAAVHFYELIQQNKDASPSEFNTWYSNTGSLTPTQIDRNAMFIYFWFTTGTPNPPKGKRKNKLTPFLNATESYNIILM